MNTSFNALVLHETEGKTQATVETLNIDDLPEGEVLIRVSHSGINYKDALAVTGKGKIVTQFPFVPGIDLVGEVIESQDRVFKNGDKVILTGCGVGERHWGGHSEYVCVKAKWLVLLPSVLSEQQAMIIGTAGFTAALCVQALVEAGIKPQHGEVIVSGASGGVGSFAVALLSNMGYSVNAITRPNSNNYLSQLGAKNFITREQAASDARPLEKGRWIAGIDTVGDKILARMLAEMAYNGIILACGLAGGFKLSTTVMPFILRGVTLRGIDSVMYPTNERQKIWQLLADNTPPEHYALIHHSEIDLQQLPQACEKILGGEIQGRITVSL